MCCKDFDEKLIDNVRNFPIIYDQSKKTFKDRLAKDTAWTNVASNLNRDVEECKVRWRTIRDSYKRIKKRNAESDAPLKSKYNRDNLKFLESFLLDSCSQCSAQEDDVKPCESNNSDNESRNEEQVINEEQENYNYEDNSEMIVNEGVNEIVNENETINENVSVPFQEQEWLEILRRLIEKKEVSETDNPIFTFFKSMAQTVAHFPPHIISETRIKICQIIAEMEAKILYEQNQQNVPFHTLPPSLNTQIPPNSYDVPSTHHISTQVPSPVSTAHNHVSPPENSNTKTHKRRKQSKQCC